MFLLFPAKNLWRDLNSTWLNGWCLEDVIIWYHVCSMNCLWILRDWVQLQRPMSKLVSKPAMPRHQTQIATHPRAKHVTRDRQCQLDTLHYCIFLQYFPSPKHSSLVDSVWSKAKPAMHKPQSASEGSHLLKAVMNGWNKRVRPQWMGLAMLVTSCDI